MHTPPFSPNRRRFLNALSLSTAALLVPGVFAEELARTVRVEEGPFYPDKLPLDTDNDLLIINDAITPAIGEVTHLGGRLLDSKGNPIRNALIEIWQVDTKGVYLRDRPAHPGKYDANFQGFGRFVTGSSGEYLFRTIKPVPYPGRSPHVHFKIKLKGKDALTTQCYIKGHSGNERDGIWRSIRDEKLRDLVTIDFSPIEDSRLGELAAKFDIVLGITPQA